MNRLDEKISIIDSISYDGVDFEIIAYNNLEGAQNVETAMGLFFASQAGLKMKQVRIKLNNSAVKTEAGALYYYKGNIQSKSNTQIELLQKRDSMLLQNQLNLQRQIDQTSKDLIRFERQISQYD